MINWYVRTCACVLGVAFSSSAFAEEDTISLADYLNTMDKTEVKFFGELYFDDETVLLVNDLGIFRVNVDNGRKDREFIEDNCEISYSLDGYPCAAKGTGTVEIDGSSIEISVNEFDKLFNLED